MPETVTPHVVIEGRPNLTLRVWQHCDIKPIVLSSRPLLSPIYALDRDRDAEPNLFCFYGILCIPKVRELFPEFDFIERLRTILDVARARFRLEPGEPLNVVAAGSHGSLWAHEHGWVGTMANPFEFESERHLGGDPPGDPESSISATDPNSPEERRSLEALALLREAAENRSYVRHIRQTLALIPGVEPRWLRQCFDHLRPWQSTRSEELQGVARMARRFMSEPYSTSLGDAIPQIYVRRGTHWSLFSRYDSLDKIEPVRAPDNPLRTTFQLVRQFAGLDLDDWHEAVLTKVLPRQLMHGTPNPLDNPLIGFNQREAARNANISCILLDAERGVIDLPDPEPLLVAQNAGDGQASSDDSSLVLEMLAKLVIFGNLAATELDVSLHPAVVNDQGMEKFWTVVDQLAALATGFLSSSSLLPLQHDREYAVREATDQLTSCVSAMHESLALLADFGEGPLPPIVKRIRADLREMALASRLLVEFLRRRDPGISASQELGASDSGISYLIAELRDPDIYAI